MTSQLDSRDMLRQGAQISSRIYSRHASTGTGFSVLEDDANEHIHRTSQPSHELMSIPRQIDSAAYPIDSPLHALPGLPTSPSSFRDTTSMLSPTSRATTCCQLQTITNTSTAEEYIQHNNTRETFSTTTANVDACQTSTYTSKRKRKTHTLADACRQFLQCAICQELISNPIAIPDCRHMFCRPCINLWQTACSKANRASVCPSCRVEFQKQKLLIPAGVQDMLDTFHLEVGWTTVTGRQGRRMHSPSSPSLLYIRC